MEENKVVAKVNGKEIDQADIFKFLNEIDPQVASQFNTPEGVQKVIDELINQELMYLDAKEKNLDDEKEYQEMLEDNKKALLKSYALNKLIIGVVPTEEDLKNYYDEHQDQMKKAETRVASHILVETEEKAKEILKEMDDGLKFEEAAEKYSSCASKEQGGSLGEFERGKMIPEFEEKAFSMEKEEISEPVKSQFGYHIIRVDDINEAGVKSFEDAKNDINQMLTRLKQQDAYLAKVDELKEKYKVERFA